MPHCISYQEMDTLEAALLERSEFTKEERDLLLDALRELRGARGHLAKLNKQTKKC